MVSSANRVPSLKSSCHTHFDSRPLRLHSYFFFRFADDNVGINPDEINAIRYLTFYSSWIEGDQGRFVTLRFELDHGPWTLTIAGDDTKFALSHLCDKLGKPIEVPSWSFSNLR
jgi:hypothetical protein